MYEWELVGASYEFDMVKIIKNDETGQYLWAHDSGCSCPVPWEDTRIEDFQPLKETWDSFVRALGEGSRYGEVSLEDRDRYKRIAKGLLNE
jgi:hypothetical protein